MNWDDLRIVIALSREKSLVAASHRIGVDKTTIGRRLRSLEESLGAILFDRREGTWRITSVGRRVLERAQRIEEDIAAIERTTEAETKSVSGLVRVTSVAGIISEYLAPRLPEIYAKHPDFRLDLVDSDANLNLTRREADVAIRMSRPESGDFVIRKVSVMSFAVYESAVPGVVPRDGDWVGYNENLARVPEMRWLEDHLGGGRIRLRENGARTLCAAVASGVGRGILACFVADVQPNLRRHRGEGPVLSRDMWMLVHRDARESARVAVVTDWLVDRFAADGGLFRGDGAQASGRKRQRI
jgi:DNA-binding transcriptional LysR family regulator